MRTRNKTLVMFDFIFYSLFYYFLNKLFLQITRDRLKHYRTRAAKSPIFSKIFFGHGKQDETSWQEYIGNISLNLVNSA